MPFAPMPSLMTNLLSLFRGGRPAPMPSNEQATHKPVHDARAEAAAADWDPVPPVPDAKLVEAAARLVMNASPLEDVSLSKETDPDARGLQGPVLIKSLQLDDGTTVHARDENFVPIALAHRTGRQRLLNLTLRKLYRDVAVVKALLAAGAEPCGAVVHHAARCGRDDILALLLDAGGNIDSIDRCEGTVEVPGDQREVVRRYNSIERRDLAIEPYFGASCWAFGDYTERRSDPQAQAAIDEARRRAVPGRLTAELLNGQFDGGPTPLWFAILQRMPTEDRQAELDRLVARGADVRLAIIAHDTSASKMPPLVEHLLSQPNNAGATETVAKALVSKPTMDSAMVLIERGSREVLEQRQGRATLVQEVFWALSTPLLSEEAVRPFVDLRQRFTDAGYSVEGHPEALGILIEKALKRANAEALDEALGLGGALHQALDDGYPGLGPQGMDLLLARIDAATLNAAPIRGTHGPLWLNLLLDACQDAEGNVKPEVCYALIARMVALGADVSREGICRGLPDDQRSARVEKAFHLMDPLRQYIEDIELRATAAEIEVESPPVHRPRRRL
ncbi:ankyrin repeat domain-containing protein [Burkholderia vietnamiensis]|uniref:ankyrin repeat domain-containing protein n=1 Tax=Burkholderia vietnamiensis TaxID=60552 RepID=UPI001BA0C2FE|nr:ankyrin repeat domain-containing protein [Burkholderia vietnamiensis]MBR8082566.1 ankyrin repeat domain-containing protein [Burkholderia vietnamiensis]